LAGIYAISDIHGCSKTFIALVEDVIQLKKEDTLFLLGDYIDRGPDSKGVIDYILQLKQTGFKIQALKGNHEDMLLKSILDPSYLKMFLYNGGERTLESFSVSHPRLLPEKYLDFFQSLPFYAIYKEFILVHAGVNSDAEDPLRDYDSMIWTRRFKVEGKIAHNFVVHGHTPVPIMEIQESARVVDRDRKINIDNGCVFGLNEFYGNLCCLELETRKIYFQPNIDQKPLF
jgi:serine/threonine protein phosphatase 1